MSAGVCLSYPSCCLSAPVRLTLTVVSDTELSATWENPAQTLGRLGAELRVTAPAGGVPAVPTVNGPGGVGTYTQSISNLQPNTEYSVLACLGEPGQTFACLQPPQTATTKPASEYPHTHTRHLLC